MDPPLGPLPVLEPARTGALSTNPEDITYPNHPAHPEYLSTTPS